MDKLKMMSMDRTSENIEKIRAIFPNCVTEVLRDGKEEYAIDFDMLRQELSKDIVEGREERYQMTWPDKKKAIWLANSQITKTLRPCREESVDFDNTENLYIEGDNLEVLKLLQETYLGKVKMIYIDPPYNTGKDSFVYNDIYSMDEEDFKKAGGYYDEEGNRVIDVKENSESNGRFHTDWLNMIYPRLKIARDLLSDDGVIFISIDDNEQANLKKVCDEVFGEDNFVGQITAVGNPRGRDYGGVARMHDYLLVYGRSYETQINLINDKDSEFKLFDSLGGFELRELRNRNIKFNKGNRPNLYYPFYINPKKKDENGLFEISLNRQEGWIELYPLESQGVNTVWRWGKEKSLKNLNINIAAKPMKNGSYMIVEKYRESKIMARSVWWDKDTNTEKGTLLLKDLLNGKIFDYPKTVEMLIRTIQMGTESMDKNIILDFFSGSATTAHAVMQLNAEDGGNRKFIMVQLPEACDEKSEAYKAGYKNICEIGKERIRRAGKKIKEESPLTTANLDTGFRVLKLDSSNMRDVFYKPEELTQMSMLDTQDNIKPDRSAEDLLFQVMLDMGAPLSAKIEQKSVCGKQVFTVADNYLMACFEDNLAEDVITAIAKQQPLYAVFRDSSFATDSVAKNVEQIFATYSPDTKLSIL